MAQGEHPPWIRDDIAPEGEEWFARRRQHGLLRVGGSGAAKVVGLSDIFWKGDKAIFSNVKTDILLFAFGELDSVPPSGHLEFGHAGEPRIRTFHSQTLLYDVRAPVYVSYRNPATGEEWDWLSITTDGLTYDPRYPGHRISCEYKTRVASLGRDGRLWSPDHEALLRKYFVQCQMQALLLHSPCTQFIACGWDTESSHRLPPNPDKEPLRPDDPWPLRCYAGVRVPAWPEFQEALLKAISEQRRIMMAVREVCLGAVLRANERLAPDATAKDRALEAARVVEGDALGARGLRNCVARALAFRRTWERLIPRAKDLEPIVEGVNGARFTMPLCEPPLAEWTSYM